MRRFDIINSCNNILAALQESQIRAVLVSSRADDKFDPEQALMSYQTFQRHFEKFSESEKEILRIFDLDRLSDYKLWAKILSSQERKNFLEDTYPLRRGLTNIELYLKQFLELLKQDHVSYVRKELNTILESNLSEDRAIISMILPESDKEISKPQRLIESIECITSFYQTVATVYNENPDDLGIAAMDSGSDKSFDFLGAAKVITGVKELIIELWDRIVFFKERKFAQQIELIAKALPVYEQINSLQNVGTLSPEQGELLRRNLESGVSKFIRVGAVLPEFDRHSHYNPRQIMSAEPKLLGYPEGEKDVENVEKKTAKTKKESSKKSIEDENSNEGSDIQFTPEQLAQIQKLLNNKKGSSRPKKNIPRKKDI